MRASHWRRCAWTLALFLGLIGTFAWCPQPLAAQTAATGSSGTAQAKPYAAEEFPDWLKTLRRFEVISIGSFPVAYMDVKLVYDLGNYIGRYATGDSSWSSYLPIFGNPKYTQEDYTRIIVASICVALAVGLGDLLVGAAEQAEAAAKAKAAKEAALQRMMAPVKDSSLPAPEGTPPLPPDAGADAMPLPPAGVKPVQAGGV
jgi:hypothetical protein